MCALQFDNSSTYLNVGGAGVDPFQVASKTLLFWAKPAANTVNYDMIFSLNHGNYYITFRSANRLFVSWINGSGEQKTAILGNVNDVDIGIWKPYAVVFDVNGNDVTVTAYKDAQVIGSPSVHSDGYYGAYGSVAYIGTANGASNWYNGDLAEVSFWNRVLYQTEIQTYMHRKLTGGELGLVGYWPMDDAGTGTGVQIKDISGGGNPGVMTGFSGNPWRGGPPVNRGIVI